MEIGTKVKLKEAMLGEDAGAIGYVFNLYPDVDHRNEFVAQIIFERGNFDGFPIEKQEKYLEDLGIDERYATYKFTNVINTYNDWYDGFWRFDNGEE